MASLEQSPLLEGLNQAQRDAVVHRGGPLLILAGAGSGKTRVITVKIAWLIRECGIDPGSILALTFTNKAAAEMRERAGQLEESASRVLIKTFHSFGAWLLRRHAQYAGLDPNFSIYDDEDSLQLLSLLYPDRPKAILSTYAHGISRAKDWNQGIDSKDLHRHDLPDFVSVYETYQKRLQAIGNVDFGDLIFRTTALLKDDDAIRARFQQRFSVVLVDEYQDSNIAQFALLKELCGPQTLLCVVGDDDQSIYRFRGAEVQNILNFPSVYPGTTVIRLEENYRSTNPILQLAGAVVAQNQGRLGKTMFTKKEGGARPQIWLFGEQDSEIASIVDLILESPMETAILYRTNSQSRSFEAGLLRAGIPYKIVGTTRFYDREEVRDILCLFRFLANPRDEVSFRRIINKPARGLGGASIEKIVEKMVHSGGDLLRAAMYTIPDLSKKASRGLADFIKLCEGALAQLDTVPTEGEDGKHLGVLAQGLLHDTGLLDYHRGQDEAGGSQKEQNLEEFINAAALYPLTRQGLHEFLEVTELDAQIRDEGESTGQVTLITMHNTKGLEFDRVIISGMEEGVFPRFDDDGAELEEQRRLLYVALTRARLELILTYTQRKRVFGQFKDFDPSRFIGEMPDDLVEVRASRCYREPGFSDPWARSSGARRNHDEWAGYDSGSGSMADIPEPWPKGIAVIHEKYGEGIVTESGIKGRTAWVMVTFEHGQTLKFLPEFAPLRRL